MAPVRRSWPDGLPVGNRSTLPISSIKTMLKILPTHGSVFNKSASTLTFMIASNRWEATGAPTQGPE